MLLEEIAAKLTAEGLVAGFTLVLGKVPATPDKVIVVRETGGTAAQTFFGGSGPVEQPTFQVLFRGAPDDLPTPRTRAGESHDAMLGWGSFVAAGTRYLDATPMQPPFPLGQDANNRHQFVFNVLARKELS